MIDIVETARKNLHALARRRGRVIHVGAIPMRELSHILNSRPRLIIDQHLGAARRKFGDDVDAIIVRRCGVLRDSMPVFQHD